MTFGEAMMGDDVIENRGIDSSRIDGTGVAARADFAQLQVSLEQRKIVETLAEIIGEASGISAAPLRGFFWRSLREWQKRNQLPTTAIRDMPPRRRIRAAQEIFKTFQELVLTTLTSEYHRRRFREAYSQGYNAWIERYSGTRASAA